MGIYVIFHIKSTLTLSFWNESSNHCFMMHHWKWQCRNIKWASITGSGSIFDMSFFCLTSRKISKKALELHILCRWEGNPSYPMCWCPGTLPQTCLQNTIPKSIVPPCPLKSFPNLPGNCLNPSLYEWTSSYLRGPCMVSSVSVSEQYWTSWSCHPCSVTTR